MTVPRDGEAGVSLVETLATLAIIAVASGGAALALRPSAPGSEAEALRLAARLGAAVDRALTTGATTALEWRADGYAISVAGGPAEATRLGGGLRLETAAASLIIDGRLLGDVDLALHGPDAAWSIAFDGIAAVVSRRAR